MRHSPSHPRFLAAVLLFAAFVFPSLSAQIFDPGIFEPPIEIPDIGPLPDGGLLNHSFERGDANRDGDADVSDALFTLNFLFVAGSPARGCFDAADANDDGILDISDPLALLGFLFLGSPVLPPPVGDCGFDPTPDGLTCALESECGPAGCPALEVSGIIVRSTQCFADFAAIRVTADLLNIGAAPFRSRPGQQSFILYEEVSGSSPREVARLDFTELDVGASLQVSYDRSWPLYEAPPSVSFRAVLSLDPDIFIDGNPDNDQCADAGPWSASIGPNEISEDAHQGCN